MEEQKRLLFPGVTLKSEMDLIGQLRVENSARLVELFERGESFIGMASNGEFGKIRKLVETCSDGELLMYFAVKAFQASLVHGHLMIANYMIVQGFPFTSSMFPNILHDSIANVEDFQAAAIVQFLVSKGIDVNVASKPKWETPLFVAIRNEHIETFSLLLRLGADVNVVAMSDVMPLTVCEELEHSTERDEMIRQLVEKGAKRTWRRDDGDLLVATRGVPVMQTTKVTFRGGSSVSSGGGCFSGDAPESSVSSEQHEIAAPKFVSFSGGGCDGVGGGSMFSTISSSPASAPTGKPAMVSFRGGGCSSDDAGLNTGQALGGFDGRPLSVLSTEVTGSISVQPVVCDRVDVGGSSSSAEDSITDVLTGVGTGARFTSSGCGGVINDDALVSSLSSLSTGGDALFSIPAAEVIERASEDDRVREMEGLEPMQADPHCQLSSDGCWMFSTR